MSLIDRCRQRCHQVEEDEGFTLIELLVVLLIIGILLAIAIPTFLSVVNGANSTAAESNLQTALTSAKAYYTDNTQTYSGICGNGTGGCISTGFPTIDSGLSAVQGASSSTDPHAVSIASSADGTTVVLVAEQSGAKNCWGIYDTTSSTATFALTGGTTFTGPGTVYFFVKAPANAATVCNATAYLSGYATTGSNNLTGTITTSQVNGFPKS
jgi:type IV pilus assembly protein PilA